MDPNTFLGLSKKRAQDLAETMNVVFQLVRIDNNHFFPYPPEVERSDRIFVEIDQNRITKATVM